MIDLFEINHYIRLVTRMYTGLDISFLYNAQMDSCRFSCSYLHDPVYETKVYLFHVPDTQAAIARINFYIRDFLAILAAHGVSFRRDEKEV